MRLPPNPSLTWKADGTPVDERTGDVYFSVEDGLSESRTVFLTGCGLPERWRNGYDFTVAELGFGTGLNILALWQLWRDARPSQGWLHAVTFEGYPLEREDAERALSRWPELSGLAEQLVERWPQRALGVQRLVWADERFSLAIHTGPIDETLRQSQFKADAWFLDGFSPAKNAGMWADDIWPLVAERSKPGARAATFTVAGAVRRGLAGAGFEVSKRPGHGRKRERLEAIFTGGTPLEQSKTRRIAIIGAGIAGASLAYGLSERGQSVTVFDKANGPVEGTSGNPLALIMPRLDASDTAQARFFIESYLAACRQFEALPGCLETSVQHRAKDDTEQQRFAKVLDDPPLDLTRLEATADGVLHKRALIIRPSELLPALLSRAELRWKREPKIDLSQRTVDGETFDEIILATGWHMQTFAPWLRLKARLGQINAARGESDAPPQALASGHYALVAGHDYVWGATYEDHPGGAPKTSDAATATNADALDTLAPYWRGQARKTDSVARAGVRATTPDRLPLIGAMPDYHAIVESHAPLRKGQPVTAGLARHPGIWVAGGYGSRGFTFGPWAAGVLCSQILGDPLPTQVSSLQLVDPARQILRDLKRGLI
ncbi:MAG: FAD-dependent 5-carboxymethylaminomethyl-2-thiouridine(34) oxidoreductase MnmC [Pseudomonadota bacterium]